MTDHAVEPIAATMPGKAMRRHFPIFQKTEDPFHFLDNAATGQICEAALTALVDFESTSRANVKRGVYRLADQATQAFEQARADVANYLGAGDPNEVILTSGTTMGLNIAAGTLVPRLKAGDGILISELEHHSNIVPWQLHAEQAGAVIEPIYATQDGRLDLDELAARNTDHVKVIAVTHTSNVTGAMSDMAKLKSIAERSGAWIVVDGAQRAPHGPVDVTSLGCHMYAISSHKMFGPTGAGALWVEGDLLEELPPFLGGGEMIARVSLEKSTFAKPPHRFEAGTPPIGPIIGFGAAAAWLASLNWQHLVAHELKLTEMLINGLEKIDDVQLVGPKSLQQRLGVVTFDVEGVHPHDLCQMIDQFGVCLRGGHHCAQPLMDKFDLVATSRASLAPYNDADDIEAFTNGVNAIIRRLR